MNSKETIETVEYYVNGYDNLHELCREMLASLSLSGNAEWPIGAKEVQELVSVWRNRFENYTSHKNPQADSIAELLIPDTCECCGGDGELYDSEIDSEYPCPNCKDRMTESPYPFLRELTDWLREVDLLEYFRDIYKDYGDLNVCFSTEEAMRRFGRKPTAGLTYSLPHPVHFREGMAVRNKIRELTKHEFDSMWYDENWIPAVIAVLDLTTCNSVV